MKDQYYIFYKVAGFKDGFEDKRLQAGPYSWFEIEQQRKDIDAFEGVYDLQIRNAEDVEEN